MRCKTRRNGTSATSANAIFTPKSATPSETHRGAIGPTPSSGKTSFAQATSTPGAMNERLAEKAMLKKRAVSRALPTKEETSGARHQTPARRRLNEFMRRQPYAGTTRNA